MLCSVRLRRTLLVCIAVSFAAIDLAHKSFTHAEFHHARTPFIALIMAAVITALVVLVPRVPSNAAACGAGIACGGALGNFISLLAWSQGVPDPLVVSGTHYAGTHYGLAFNLADLFAITGDALLLSAIVLYGMRHRARLRESV
jgi:lipoprotein signal peptidase